MYYNLDHNLKCDLAPQKYTLYIRMEGASNKTLKVKWRERCSWALKNNNIRDVDCASPPMCMIYACSPRRKRNESWFSVGEGDIVFFLFKKIKCHILNKTCRYKNNLIELKNTSKSFGVPKFSSFYSLAPHHEQSLLPPLYLYLSKANLLKTMSL